ncbi:ABC transporter permease [Thermogemmatispora sp.]|uniref:ABC transporter permease n=1 Tax=Thermogemmatispora sp. TaxID=1968838 RepID=UPI001D6F2110|nr:ABC-2 family transporter protein [Thermogemmatispora sp.]MBX5449260.1 ABC-2 family transporter protein [Thermogemmatispora sp.]
MMRTYLRLLATFFRVSLLGELAYRANFWLQMVESLIELGTALALVSVVFTYTQSLNGWHASELLILIGTYFLIGGAINMVIMPGMSRLIEQVRLGTLDYLLTKPEEAQLLVSIQRLDIWKLLDLLLGLALLVAATIWHGSWPDPLQVLAFALTLLAGTAIVYSFVLFLATLSFWYVRVENILVIFESMYEAGRWPVDIYPGWLRATLTFIVPVAFAVTVPAEALTARLTWLALLGTLTLAALSLLVARLFWRFAIRSYSGASA